MLKYTNALFRRAYSDLYKELCTHNPDILGWIYKTLDQPWKYRKRKLAMDLLNAGRLIRLLMKEKPDVAVCTHFLSAEILLFLKRRKVLNRLLSNKERLLSMREAVRRFARPNAASDIVSILLKS